VILYYRSYRLLFVLQLVLLIYFQYYEFMAFVMTCMDVCMYVCTYVRMYVCMYVRMYVCMYVCMYVHYPPQGSVLRSSAAQRVDGDFRVRAPSFQSSAYPLLGATLRAHSLAISHSCCCRHKRRPIF
jgi:hypothetical protein